MKPFDFQAGDRLVNSRTKQEFIINKAMAQREEMEPRFHDIFGVSNDIPVNYTFECQAVPDPEMTIREKSKLGFRAVFARLPEFFTENYDEKISKIFGVQLTSKDFRFQKLVNIAMIFGIAGFTQRESEFAAIGAVIATHNDNPEKAAGLFRAIYLIGPARPTVRTEDINALSEHFPGIRAALKPSFSAPNPTVTALKDWIVEIGNKFIVTGCR